MDLASDAKSNSLSDTSPEVDERCQPNINEVEVFQVLGDMGALANVCEKDSNICIGLTVAIPFDGELLWDKKRIKAPKGMCVTFDNTFSYEATNGSQKTVPVLGFRFKYPPRNEDEYRERVEYVNAKFKKQCDFDMKESRSMSPEKASKFCNCYASEFEKFLLSESAQSQADWDASADEFTVQVEKTCGKYPKK